MAGGRIAFGTKAETLARLEGRLVHARVLPQRQMTWAVWRDDRAAALAQLAAVPWARTPRIVRSSARHEDSAGASQAGKYLSIPNVLDANVLAIAIDGVFASYGMPRDDDQVFVQPMLRDASISGVAFTRDPNTGAPYIIINYDESGDTAAVTGGRATNLRVFVLSKLLAAHVAPPLDRLVALCRELEAALDHDALDIEFAFDRDGGLVLLQARPLAGVAAAIDGERHSALLLAIEDKIATAAAPHPYLRGKRSIFGVMPDWNPAEMIGVRPRPLALSLYRHLITDSIWAYQRHNYGYRNLRSFPLMLSLHGLPYVDVRVCFNSFIPAEIDDDLAERLVDHYVDRLAAAPELHDKVEFDVVFSCYAFDLAARIERLRGAGFTNRDVESLIAALRRLTNRVLAGENALWRSDLRRIGELEQRQRTILAAGLNLIGRIYWLVEDCRRYGTLPFAGIARAGFIAMQMLDSLVVTGAIDAQQRIVFLAGLDTVGSRLTQDHRMLDRAAFMARYGHLRPGTYDITSPRYDEAPERYFTAAASDEAASHAQEAFTLSVPQMRAIDRMLREHGVETDVVGLFEFLQAAIQGREHAKFVFTRSLSQVLTLLRELGDAHGLDAEAMSYFDIRRIDDLHASSVDAGAMLRHVISEGRARHAETLAVVLPPLIRSPEEVRGFEIPASLPNFVTQASAEGPVVPHTASPETLRRAIVCIPSADPGFDWIFSHGIAGFVTAYGGINSHMAIRANELKLPAVVGAGELRFARWSKARHLRLDCANRRVEVVA